MKDRALTTCPKPQGPRNLAPHVAAWLRRIGFVATEHLLPEYASVTAHWTGSQSEHFLFDYTWVSSPVPEASCGLRVLYADRPGSLFTAQRVHRVKDVRRLLTGCVRLYNARLLAKLLAPSPNFQSLSSHSMRLNTDPARSSNTLTAHPVNPAPLPYEVAGLMLILPLAPAAGRSWGEVQRVSLNLERFVDFA